MNKFNAPHVSSKNGMLQFTKMVYAIMCSCFIVMETQAYMILNDYGRKGKVCIKMCPCGTGGVETLRCAAYLAMDQK